MAREARALCAVIGLCALVTGALTGATLAIALTAQGQLFEAHAGAGEAQARPMAAERLAPESAIVRVFADGCTAERDDSGEISLYCPRGVRPMCPAPARGTDGCLVRASGKVDCLRWLADGEASAPERGVDVSLYR